MFLHITFTDGSNPFVQYRKKNGQLLRTKREVSNALRRWKRRYNITGHWSSDGYMATATSKDIGTPGVSA